MSRQDSCRSSPRLHLPRPHGPRHRPDLGDAFLPDPSEGHRSRTNVDLAEFCAEEYVASATMAEHEFDEARNQVLSEELGGPYVVTTAEEVFADGTDASNPEDAEPSPFPTAIRSPEK